MRGNMRGSIIPAALLLTLVSSARSGYVSRYDPGVFEAVVSHRFVNGWWRNEPPADWDTVAGYAATTDCNQVGQVLLMRPVGATTWERVLVADCSGDLESMNWMLDNNIIAGWITDCSCVGRPSMGCRWPWRCGRLGCDTM